MSKKRIVIIEDESDMADLVAARLRKEHYETFTAYDGNEGLHEIRARHPDLVVLDIMLPGMSGTEVLKQVRSDPQICHIPVVMLTARTEEADVVAGLQLGADDYVTKPFSMSVLMARIEALMRRKGSQGSSSPRLQAGPISINRDTHQVTVNNKNITLTLTEFRILAAIVAAHGRILTRSQLIDKGIGPDAIVTDRTIDVHLASLRSKLGKARKFIQTVRGVGYRLATEEYETA